MWGARGKGKSMVLLKPMGYVTVTDGARDIVEWARLLLDRAQEFNSIQC